MKSFVMRLDDKPHTHDFRKSYWGHAMHRQTWVDKLIRPVWWMFWKKPRRLTTVMVHCSGLREGDSVIYNAVSGEKVAEVTDMTGTWNVDDMFEITLANIRDYRP